MESVEELKAGEVGYFAAIIRDPLDVNIGDTVTSVVRPATIPIPGFRRNIPMVFAGIFPINTNEFENLKKSLEKLMQSMDKQSVPWVHILLWDDKREDDYLSSNFRFAIKNPYNICSSRSDCIRYSIVIPGSFVRGPASGSALRAVGLMAANTTYVTFADTDVWYDPNHFELLIKAIEGKEWAYTVRRIWASEDECIGEDRFESVGDDSKLSYKLIDNSSLLVTRKFAASSACLYRETEEYNDDRLMFAFLKKYAGIPGKTNVATVNQICPPSLKEMFRSYCAK
jgi:hypothetical protein